MTTRSCLNSGHDAILWLGSNKKYDFKILKQYQFEVSVKNTSKTNVPRNEFSLISYKNLDNEPIFTPIRNVFTEIWRWLLGIIFRFK